MCYTHTYGLHSSSVCHTNNEANNLAKRNLVVVFKCSLNIIGDRESATDKILQHFAQTNSCNYHNNCMKKYCNLHLLKESKAMKDNDTEYLSLVM